MLVLRWTKILLRSGDVSFVSNKVIINLIKSLKRFYIYSNKVTIDLIKSLKRLF